MDLSKLSSNWKELQKTLGRGDSQRPNNHTSRTTQFTKKAQVKRKDTSEAPERRKNNGLGVKRRKISGSSLHSPRTSESQSQSPAMGAYVSSFRTASYAVEEPRGENTNDEDKPATQTLPSTIQAGKYVSLDCEMVGTTTATAFSTHFHHRPTLPNEPQEHSILARVSVVSYKGDTLYDTYVLPPPGVPITNYRTPYSGITAGHLSPTASPPPKQFTVAQNEVAALLDGRVLVGHALQNDLAVLGLSHPPWDIRDTSRHPKFRELAAVAGKNGAMGSGRTPSLRKLAEQVLGWKIQAEHGRGGHDSVQDAQAAMALFRMEKNGFEREAAKKFLGKGVGKGGEKASTGKKPGDLKDQNPVMHASDDFDISEAGGHGAGAPEDGHDEGGQVAAEDSEVEDAQGSAPKRKRRKKKKKKSRMKR